MCDFVIKEKLVISLNCISVPSLIFFPFLQLWNARPLAPSHRLSSPAGQASAHECADLLLLCFPLSCLPHTTLDTGAQLTQRGRRGESQMMTFFSYNFILSLRVKLAFNLIYLDDIYLHDPYNNLFFPFALEGKIILCYSKIILLWYFYSDPEICNVF